MSPPNYFRQGDQALIVGGEQKVLSGGEIDIEAGGALKIAGVAVTPSAAALNTLDGGPAAATITVGAEAGDAIAVTVQLKDADGSDLAVRGAVLAYLSDDANGDSIAGTAPDGNVAIGTDGLAIPLVADKAFVLVSEADGDIDLTIGESGADTWYLILVLPNGKLVASGAITFAA